MELFQRIYLPFYFMLVLLFAFVVPTWRTYKKTGVNPVSFGGAPTAHNYIGQVMKVLLVLLFIAILLNSAGDAVYQYTLPAYFLESTGVRTAGLVMMHLALVWIIFAQVQMSTSWRIGIDEKNPTELVTGGLFSISRNPIFLGMIAAVLGLFLIIPNAVTLALMLAIYIVIQIQIRLEEEFLSRSHGEAYSRYCKTTRRLI